MRKALVFVLLACQLCSASWQDVQALAQGAKVEVSRKTGGPVSGTVGTVSADSISVVTKQQEVSVPRADVSRIVASRRGHAKWIGLAIGAGAGAGTGAAVGARLANESAGDIDIKTGATAGLAVVGALIGLAIGSTLDSRHSTIYTAP
jgi:hypothetical protein